jgi:hypothetical protein
MREPAPTEENCLSKVAESDIVLTESIVGKGRCETFQRSIEFYTCTEAESSNGGRKGGIGDHEVTICMAAL